MNKRLLKRNTRQVSRAKDRVRVSQPDVRTPEQLTAAREASRSICGRASRDVVRAYKWFKARGELEYSFRNICPKPE